MAVDRLSTTPGITVLVGAAVGAGAVAALVALAIGDRYLALVGSLDHARLALGVLGLLTALAWLLAGTMGVAILGAATIVGLVPVVGGAHRVHCMGVLIGPLLLAA